MKRFRLLFVLSCLALPAALIAQDNTTIIKNLLTTTRTVTGQEIKLYPKPEVRVSVYTLAAGKRLPTHKHPHQRLGYVLEGIVDLVEIESNKTTRFKEGEMLAEMRDQWHYGANNSKADARLLIIDIVPPKAKTNVILEDGLAAPSPATPPKILTKTLAGQRIFVPRAPEVRSAIYEIAAKTSFPMHKHQFPRMFYILSGSIDVIDGETREIKKMEAGEFVVESMNRLHYGENNSDDPVRILVIDLVPAGAPSNTILHDVLHTH